MSDRVFILAAAAILIIPGCIVGALGAYWGKADLLAASGTLIAGGAAVIATRNKTFTEPGDK